MPHPQHQAPIKLHLDHILGRVKINLTKNSGNKFFSEIIFPLAVILLNADSSFVGSGALIDNFHILTVAHKVSNYA